MASLKHADRFMNAFNKAQDEQLEPQAQEKLATQLGKRSAVAALKDSGKVPSAKGALAHLMARRPDLFEQEETSTEEEATSPSNGVAAQA